LQHLAELHRSAGAFGAPMVLVDAAAQKYDTKTLREITCCRRICQGIDDSSQGSAIVQPAPRSTTRREKARERGDGEECV
jgi:hypothetical protein